MGLRVCPFQLFDREFKPRPPNMMAFGELRMENELKEAAEFRTHGQGARHSGLGCQERGKP